MRTFEPVKIALPNDASQREQPLQELLFGPLHSLVEGRVRTTGPVDQSFDTYVLIEAARRPDIKLLLEAFETNYCCLYDGDAAEDFNRTAPFLARVEANSDFAEWLVNEHWGKKAAVFIRSNASLIDMRRQFRKFTQIRDPETNRWYHFRFYAPETARRILPVLDPKDFAQIAKGISAFIVESADGKSAYLI